MLHLLKVVLCLSLVGVSVAHEHHGDAIPDGEVISADPIVCPVPRKSNSIMCDCG